VHFFKNIHELADVDNNGRDGAGCRLLLWIFANCAIALLNHKIWELAWFLHLMKNAPQLEQIPWPFMGWKSCTYSGL